MKPIGREDLKKYFKTGEIPSENNYISLIDSMINKQDDGFSKDAENGFVLTAGAGSGKFISLYENRDDLYPFFVVENDEERQGLKFTPGKTNEPDAKNPVSSTTYFHSDGSLGLGKRADPDCKLDVDGFAGLKGRTGTFRQGKIPADGKWHPIVQDLDNCNAFEVMARTGTRKSERFAIMHAIVVRATPKGRFGIRRTESHFGGYWSKLKIKWEKESRNSYSLKMKTNCFYGEGIEIYYNVTRLWDDEKFMPEEYLV